MALGAWGNYLSFEVSSTPILTCDGVTVEGAARWATHDVVGLLPVYEYIGPGLHTCVLQVRAAVPQGVNARELVNTLRGAKNTGASAVLVIGDYPVFAAGSLAVLDSVRELHDYRDKRGNDYVVNLTLTFHELVPRKLAAVAPAVTTSLTRPKAQVSRR